MTIQEIYDYANVLTETIFSDLSEVIEYMNEAQDVIANFDHVEAYPISYTLTDNHRFALPEDFLMVAHFEFEGRRIDLSPVTIWNTIMILPETMTSGTLTMYYYKIPERLVATDPTQVPEVKPCYHRAMSYYIAKVYHLIDDDQALRAQFEQEFHRKLQEAKMPSGNIKTYHGF
jgi:hypothetical protein